ncbi:MAG: TIM44-like domain-containing protein [Clostridiales Family XIII bacterium]|jgi:hypothetical protein|nr:TIM44-like domain-containing protein [Clostridiales Family XIII bacterium]
MKKRSVSVALCATVVIWCASGIAYGAGGFGGARNEYDYSNGNGVETGYYDEYGYARSDDDDRDSGSLFWRASGIVFMLIVAAVSRIRRKNEDKSRKYTEYEEQASFDKNEGEKEYNRTAGNVSGVMSEFEVVSAIKKTDPDFDGDQFEAWAQDLFLALNAAWTERNWSKIRIFESNNLYREHEAMLKEFRESGRINVIDEISVENVVLRWFERDEDYEYLEVLLRVQMLDYVVDEATMETISGDRNKICHRWYDLRFMRTRGSKTQRNLGEIGVANCPNCGAPMQMTATGLCEYCKSLVTSGEYNWVLISYKGRHLN